MSGDSDEQRGDFLQVQRRTTDEAIVVQVVGELDLVTNPRLVDELSAAREQVAPPGPLVVDLTGVTFMASVGLGTLVEHSRLCRDADVELRVVAGNRTVLRAISLTGLDELLSVLTTLSEALAAPS
jgi:anti-sigma B factor antagonist